MLYTSASRALCVIEIAVRTPLGCIPIDYKIVTLDIPVHSILKMDRSTLPSDWDSLPHSDSTQKIGDEFIHNGKFLALKVPSAAVQDEFNYLINPNHKDMNKVRIINVQPFTFDERLFIRTTP